MIIMKYPGSRSGSSDDDNE